MNRKLGLEIHVIHTGAMSQEGDVLELHDAMRKPATDRAMDDLADVGILELLDGDIRPVLITDLYHVPKKTPLYFNASYRHLQTIQRRASGLSTPNGSENHPEHESFIEWGCTHSEDGEVYPKIHWGLQWRAQTLRGRWRVISGLLESHHSALVRHQKTAAATATYYPYFGRLTELARERSPPVTPLSSGQSNTVVERVLAETSEDQNPFDFDTLGTGMITEHVKFILNFDWASTPLGPISSWSTDLRRNCNFLLSDPRPAALYYGPERVMIYNEKYVEIVGLKHPYMMGKPLRIAWAEILDDFGPRFDRVYETGIAETGEDALVYINRGGYIEETYFSLSIIPLSTSTGDPACYNSAFETSRQVIADRRITFLLHLGQSIASAREPKDFWAQLLKGLQDNHLDVPFAFLYSAGIDVNESLSSSSEQSQGLQTWALEGCVRVPEHPAHIPQRLNQGHSPERFLKNFSEMLKDENPTLLSISDGTFPADLLTDLRNQEADIGDEALFCPIRSTGNNVLGFLILGVNPRQRYGKDYELFIQILNRQLATALATAVLFEEEIRRGQLAAELATMHRDYLSKQLALHKHEAVALESRFRKMADMAPVGMFHMNIIGELIYANENYYQLTQLSPEARESFSWYDMIAEIDQPLMDVKWHKLLDGQSVSFELRLKTTFVSPSSINGKQAEGNTWILAAAYPEKNEDGEVTGILGCLTDISRQKWAEDVQAQKMCEALELKRQQESFIDMTSHEMRNPLSAIVQCADFIATSLAEFSNESSEAISSVPKDIIDSHIDAAETIMHCGQHQKRIIDDILILSKINSHLLTITPVDVQPMDVIKNALRMFDGELHKNDTELRFRVEQSYVNAKVDWLQLDPSRLLQVLINLTSNAIKFTQPEKERKITIRLGASQEIPQNREDMKYLQRDPDRKDLSFGPTWGSGDFLYLHIEVEDTGRGLDEYERKLLFQRFSQASPRTHVAYGGSGLGLFISKELTELQGGQIGVRSETGVGSTFAFYIRTRRGSPTQPSISHALAINTELPIRPSKDGVRHSRQKPSLQKIDPLVWDQPRHILVVEDNIVNQKVLSKQLRSAGCIVFVANHGQEALDFLEASEFWKDSPTGKELPNFVCLMDLEMPVMDGLTCVKKIRELQQDGTIIKHLPVIAVTANARSEQIVVAKEAGMDSVVTKPFRIPELIPELDRILLKGSS
ncbi:histidine kinase hhk13p [Phlyctema vagabunda]|uniref:Histidine kinase hhk13p n=1 Tax=Phlyctema vagabunda TaxID=108571 RepID=A0ABR4PUC2_9HELO